MLSVSHSMGFVTQYTNVHICLGNGLVPARHQAITWTNAVNHGSDFGHLSSSWASDGTTVVNIWETVDRAITRHDRVIMTLDRAITILSGCMVIPYCGAGRWMDIDTFKFTFIFCIHCGGSSPVHNKVMFVIPFLNENCFSPRDTEFIESN